MSIEIPGHVDEPIDHHSGTIDIGAPPVAVWELVTAMERYGEWSPENTGGYWRKGADGEPGTGQIGDQFVGINRRDGQEWKALVEIVRRIDHEDFAFVTGGLEYNLVLWRYQLEPIDGGTRLTQSWTLRQLSPNMIEKGRSEVDFRTANARESIEVTLAAMKAAAEA